VPELHEYDIVDVFAEARYSGNQLAIVYIDGTEPDEWLQRVANEFGFSETVYLPIDIHSDAPVATRIFTPQIEVPFAGHPTLGAAWAVRRTTGRDRVELAEKAGTIATWAEQDTDCETLWMSQNVPEFGTTFSVAGAEDGPVGSLAEALTIEPRDLAPEPKPQIVSTGLPFLIVRLADRAAVARAKEKPDVLTGWLGDEGPQAVLVFATEAEEAGHAIRARMFASAFGIAEDPATGSANGCMAAYLVRHRVLGTDSIDVAVEQGYEMGRPSVLYLRADTKSVTVGGRVQHVASGRLT
jgi:trans-2,3-dihydro-3-hydroxyanthranilate isomerase